MDVSTQYVILAIVTSLLFLPLVLTQMRREPPYNPHIAYWAAKNRRRRK